MFSGSIGAGRELHHQVAQQLDPNGPELALKRLALDPSKPRAQFDKRLLAAEREAGGIGHPADEIDNGKARLVRAFLLWAFRRG